MNVVSVKIVHTACVTLETINKLVSSAGTTPYSTDFAPLDFYLFEQLKDALRDNRFFSDKEVHEAVYKYLLW